MTQQYIINYCNLLNYINVDIINSKTDNIHICENICYQYLLYILFMGITFFVTGNAVYKIYYIMNNSVIKYKHINDIDSDETDSDETDSDETDSYDNKSYEHESVEHELDINKLDINDLDINKLDKLANIIKCNNSTDLQDDNIELLDNDIVI